jgi:hypothetical protein
LGTKVIGWHIRANTRTSSLTRTFYRSVTGGIATN